MDRILPKLPPPALLALPTFALGACSDDDDNPLDPTFTDRAALRIVHASVDAPIMALDVALDAANDGQAEVTGFERCADTGEGCVALPAGTNLRIGVRAGEPLARASVFTTPELPAGAQLFLSATGFVDGMPDFELLPVSQAFPLVLVLTGDSLWTAVEVLPNM